MRILVMGSPESIFIQQYIKYVLNDPKMEIFLTCNTSLENQLVSFYDEAGVNLINLFEAKGIIGKIPKISTYFAFVQNLRKATSDDIFDYIHIHYVGNRRLMHFVYRKLKKASRRLILTFWGSDILAIDKKASKHLTGLVKEADRITFSTQSMIDKFEEYFGIKYSEKIRKCFFGNPMIEKAQELLKTNENLEKHVAIDIPDEKYIIAVGYNGAERQQHIKILEALAELPENVKENCYVIMQIGYGMSNAEYINRIKEFMRDANLQGSFIEKYLSTEETVEFKKKVNLFIHGQTSDALSASVLEYIYLKVNILNPSWIDYKEWKSLGIRYCEYNNFKEITRLVLDFFEEKIEIPHDENSRIIADNFTWESCGVTWKKLYC